MDGRDTVPNPSTRLQRRVRTPTCDRLHVSRHLPTLYLRLFLTRPSHRPSPVTVRHHTDTPTFISPRHRTSEPPVSCTGGSSVTGVVCRSPEVDLWDLGGLERLTGDVQEEVGKGTTERWS